MRSCISNDRRRLDTLSSHNARPPFFPPYSFGHFEWDRNASWTGGQQSASTIGQDNYPYGQPDSPPFSPHEAQSIFSRDIWLGDNSGESKAFARDVEIAGWTSVGDKREGAYVGEFRVLRGTSKA